MTSRFFCILYILIKPVLFRFIKNVETFTIIKKNILLEILLPPPRGEQGALADGRGALFLCARYLYTR